MASFFGWLSLKGNPSLLRRKKKGATGQQSCPAPCLEGLLSSGSIHKFQVLAVLRQVLGIQVGSGEISGLGRPHSKTDTKGWAITLVPQMNTKVPENNIEAIFNASGGGFPKGRLRYAFEFLGGPLESFRLICFSFHRLATEASHLQWFNGTLAFKLQPANARGPMTF